MRALQRGHRNGGIGRLGRAATRMLAITPALVTALAVSGASRAGATMHTAATNTPVTPSQVVADEAAWVATAQLGGASCTGPGRGAIANHPWDTTSQPVYVAPYLANYGAMAVLLAHDSAGNATDAPAAKAWLEWYLANLNTTPDYNGLTGTMYDHTVDPVTCAEQIVLAPGTSHGLYDSSDAYAGTFLSAVKHYAAAVPTDVAWLQAPSVKSDLAMIANAVVATKSASTQLTAARPDYLGYYLMDNVEAAQGLTDYAWLEQNVLGNPTGAASWQRAASLIDGTSSSGPSGIAADLFVTGSTPPVYRPASDQANPSWTDCWTAFTQMWPTFTGLGTATTRSRTWSTYKRLYPKWASSTPIYPVPAGEYWCTSNHATEAPTAYAAALVGDTASASGWLQSSQMNWIAPANGVGRPWPWTVGDSYFRAATAKLLGG